MNKTKKLATVFAGVLAVAPLLGTSAFAESRHRSATEGGSWRQSRPEQAQRNNGRTWQQPQQRAQAQQRVQVQQYRGNWNQRSYGTARGSQNNGAVQQYRYSAPQVQYRNPAPQVQYRSTTPQYQYRSTTPQYQYRNNNAYQYRNNNAYQYRGQTTYRNQNAYRGQQQFRGRVDRIERDRDRGGYRVWIGGGAYPLFIPEAQWRLGPLSIGASIALGGYWNPLGYYDVYGYGNPYYSSVGSDVHGIVQSVDFRGGLAVVRDDATGSFVTIELLGNDPRLGALRPGMWVDLGGNFDNSGFFHAYNVLNIQAYAPYGYGDGD